MNTDVRKWTRSCVQCQRAKVQQYTVSPDSTFTTPDAWFDYIHIDIVGPLLPSNGYSYILTCIDRFTCWTEALPLVDIAAATIARPFISGWISFFGTPSTITTYHDWQLWVHALETSHGTIGFCLRYSCLLLTSKRIIYKQSMIDFLVNIMMFCHNSIIITTHTYQTSL